MTDPSSPEIPLTRSARLAVSVWILILLGGFSIAAWLTPDPRGLGTHQQLGLPPCSFQQNYGLACPSCGMTTSFSHFVRGHWYQAARSSTTGFLLALLCAIQIPWCLACVRRNCWWKVRQPELVAVYAAGLFYGVGLLEWLARLSRQ